MNDVFYARPFGRLAPNLSDTHSNLKLRHMADCDTRAPITISKGDDCAGLRSAMDAGQLLNKHIGVLREFT